MLNIEKHSRLNPQYTKNLFSLFRKIPGFTLKAFEHQGSIDAVFGYFELNGMMTSPLFGYDTSRPLEEGLYRLISAQLLLDAQEKKCLLHQSSGAGHYKTLRRAKRTFEYTAVYTRHLPLKQRIIWNGLRWNVNGIGKPLLSRFMT